MTAILEPIVVVASRVAGLEPIIVVVTCIVVSLILMHFIVCICNSSIGCQLFAIVFILATVIDCCIMNNSMDVGHLFTLLVVVVV